MDHQDYNHQHICHHHKEVSEKSIFKLIISFSINILLSVVEIIGGIISGSMSLIADALHNTSDAFSILIAVIAFRIGNKKATPKYTYGFKRAEVIGGFVNLILLFISGIYLFIEGIERIIFPRQIDGLMIIWISVFALIVDAITAKISHHHAHHNTNMKMLFIHNLADAFGSLGVIVSGIFITLFDIYFVDGIIALIIAIYMVFQSVVSFRPIVNILMNAAPDHLDLHKIEAAIKQLKGVDDVHHIHIWCVNENDISFECHIKGSNLKLVQQIHDLLAQEFDINHCNIQLENKECCHQCDL